MNKTKLNEYKKILEEFLSEYAIYTTRAYTGQDNRRTKLQRKLQLISNIVSLVHGGCSLKLSNSTTLNFYTALSYSLTDNLSGEQRDFVESNIKCTLNEAIGNIVNNTIPTRKIKPVLPIIDEELRKRCLDLLNTPGKFDTSVREATLILESRLRNSIPQEKLAELIQKSANLTFENLVNTLLSPSSPVLLISTDQRERAAFQKIMLGVGSYFRNPFHHKIDDNTEWSWAWAIIGLIDHLLFELENCVIQE